MKLSIVSTLYRSAPYIEEFCDCAGTAAQKLVGEDYEIVLVNVLDTIVRQVYGRSKK